MILQKDESIEQKKKDLEDTFKQFSEFFSEEDLKIAMEGLEDVSGELGDVVTEYTSSGISLQYKADRLTEILRMTERSNYIFKVYQSFQMIQPNYSTLCVRFLRKILL
ncbi:hypothetical protein EJ377_04175 [Chryseobacterium arthrosphaerae]|uniref:Uncharacterized protein n=1 Tax=Chryseobacterium arthrosphaerae TaxID=651561 RepID=A0A3S0NNT3_9FLAO|nr:hypothetical protein EJ377_04175 [Chryseobacterium arthrosphaerae]